MDTMLIVKTVVVLLVTVCAIIGGYHLGDRSYSAARRWQGPEH